MPHSSDPLTAVLASLRLSGSVSSHSVLRAPWGIAVAPTSGASFHGILRGTCWVTPELGQVPVRLEAGDLVLFPGGLGHVLADEPGRPARSAECLVRSGWLVEGKLRGGGTGARTEFVCGEFCVDQVGKHPLWSQLPAFVHYRHSDGSFASAAGLGSTLRRLAAEVKRPRLGSELVVMRLLDVLVVEMVRAWLAREGTASAGWLGGMRDGKVGTALALMHQSAGQDWTVASLARTVGMSRTVFAERFASLVGESPLSYLTRLRMQTAARSLRLDPVDTMISVAEKAGYRSEAAFSKAFKRIMGVSPGAYRRRAAVVAETVPGQAARFTARGA